MIVKKPDGTPYCSFNVDELTLNIRFLEGTNIRGYSVHLDRRVIPDLKKFLDSLEPSEKFLEPVIIKNSNPL